MRLTNYPVLVRMAIQVNNKQTKKHNVINFFLYAAAALLEVLDPEQNNTFHDHYLNLPYDLSSILFIATANNIHTIPQPLLDRMEVIQLHGYTFEEKLHIARTHLLPKQIQRHGLALNEIDMADDVILWIAEQYTRESGVRTLERTLASVIRAKCVELADLRENDVGYQYTPNVTQEDVLDILGVGIRHLVHC